MYNLLTKEDLDVFNQLSKCEEAAFAQCAGKYILIADFPESNSSGPLDYVGSFPREISGCTIQRLYDLGILNCIKPANSVFSHIYKINLKNLKEFEQLKEVAFQIALGTWFELSRHELDRLMDLPG